MQVKVPQCSELTRFQIDGLLRDFDALQKLSTHDMLVRWNEQAAKLLREIRDAEHAWTVTVGGGGKIDTPLTVTDAVEVLQPPGTGKRWMHVNGEWVIVDA